VITGKGKQFIVDFTVGEDLLQLGSDSFDSLLITGQGGGTQISTAQNQPLAFLQGVSPDAITEASFIG
jgi:hypothetical protein